MSEQQYDSYVDFTDDVVRALKHLRLMPGGAASKPNIASLPVLTEAIGHGSPEKAQLRLEILFKKHVSKYVDAALVHCGIIYPELNIEDRLTTYAATLPESRKNLGEPIETRTLKRWSDRGLPMVATLLLRELKHIPTADLFVRCDEQIGDLLCLHFNLSSMNLRTLDDVDDPTVILSHEPGRKILRISVADCFAFNEEAQRAEMKKNLNVKLSVPFLITVVWPMLVEPFMSVTSYGFDTDLVTKVMSGNYTSYFAVFEKEHQGERLAKLQKVDWSDMEEELLTSVD